MFHECAVMRKKAFKFIVLLIFLPVFGCNFRGKAENFQDQQACSAARRKGTVTVWQEYLKQFPEGKCALEAKAELESLQSNPQETGDVLQWSNKSPYTMNWFEAVGYCRSLTEGGYSDWRLPTAPQFREIVQNCPELETGGACNFTDECVYLNTTYKVCLDNEACRCSSAVSSKLGDTDTLWSSTVSFKPLACTASTKQFFEMKDAKKHFAVRCVRFPDLIRNKYIKMGESEAHELYEEAAGILKENSREDEDLEIWLLIEMEKYENAMKMLFKVMNSVDSGSVLYEKAYYQMLYSFFTVSSYRKVYKRMQPEEELE